MSGTIMVVDDVAANVKLLSTILKTHGYKVRPTTNPKRAVQSALHTPPDLILLDINMPDLNGLEACHLLKEDERTAHVPIIFLSAHKSMDHVVAGFNSGGIDYITKPFKAEEVLARVRTQLRVVRQHRKIKKMQQQEIEHLTEINQFQEEIVNMISHDLKNPLGVIRMYAELINRLGQEQAPDGSGKIERYAGAILNATAEMSALIEDMLRLAQLEGQLELERYPIELNTLIPEILERVRPMAALKKLSLQYEPADQELIALVNDHLFGHMLTNLLSNAIKYTPDGGRIRIDIQRRGNEVELFVQDTGIGIPEEALPHLFEKFYRVHKPEHKKQSGTGLGLAIVKAIVGRHDGNVTVNSQEGIGSTFIVTLPLTEKEKRMSWPSVEQPATGNATENDENDKPSALIHNLSQPPYHTRPFGAPSLQRPFGGVDGTS